MSKNKARKKRPPKGKPEALYLTPEEAQATYDFNKSVDEKVRGPLRCSIPVIEVRNKRMVEHYPHMDYDERTPPLEEVARQMCRGCPVIQECLKLAETIEPAQGVWGGVVFVDGKPQ